jgi:hypothetical protein
MNKPGNGQRLQHNDMGSATKYAGFSKNHLKTVSRTFFKKLKIIVLNGYQSWADTSPASNNIHQLDIKGQIPPRQRVIRIQRDSGFGYLGHQDR